MEMNFSTDVRFNQANLPVGNVPNLGSEEGVAGPIEVAKDGGGAIYNEGRPAAKPAATDVAGLKGADSIADKDLDRNDDLGQLFTKAFATPGPDKPAFLDP